VSGTEAEATGGAEAGFRAVVAAATLERTVTQLRALVEECRLGLGPDGLAVRAVDPATVAMVDLRLGAGAFREYRADGGVVGVDLERLASVLGLADRDEAVTLELLAGGRLRVEAADVEYQLGLLDPETVRSPPEETDLGFDAHAAVELGADGVDRAVDAAGMVADTARVGVDAEAAAFRVEADGDVDSVAVAREAAALEPADAADPEALFSVRYLADVVGAVPSGTTVELQVGPDRPLSLAYEYADGDGTVEYVVSPRLSR